MNKTIKNKKGITLIALVITIVVLLVLAVVAIGAVTGEDGIIKRAEQTKFLSDIGQYKEELELYKTNWAIEYQLNNRATTDEINDPSQINTWDYDEIKEKYIKSFAKKYTDKIGIKNGELVYQYIDNETEREWAEQSGLGIESEEITIEVGAEGLGTVSSSIEIKDGKIATKKGQTITITAIPGSVGEGENTVEATFKGWYNEETLITDKLEYTFKVTGKETITALFKTDASLIYYLDGTEEKIKTNTSNKISGYRNDKTIIKVEIKDDVTIQTQTFNGCENLVEVTIGDNVTIAKETNLADNTATFGDCPNLKTVKMGKNISLMGGHWFNYLFQDSKGIEEITIESIAKIEDYGLGQGISTVTGDVVINEGVTRIGSFAFLNCVNLKNITIPSTVTSIGESAFKNCTGLENNIVISENIKTIGDEAFYNCSGIRGEIKITSNTNLGAKAFNKCTNLQKLVIGDNFKIPLSSFNDCAGLVNVIIGNNVIIEKESPYVDNTATFGDCPNLKTVKMGKNISLMGGHWFNYLFQDSKGIEEITIESIAKIEDYGLGQGISTVTGDVVINEGVTRIGSFAFLNCANLKNITIPSTVTSIGESAFKNCTGLESIKINMTEEEFNNVVKGSEWAYGIPVPLPITYLK